MKKLTIATCTVLSIAALSACSPKAAVPAATEAAASSAALPRPAPSHAAVDTSAATGPVVETMNAANYTYVRVKTASGDIWAATSTFTVAVGDEVTVPLENPMANFHSETLKRDFPLIYFTPTITRAGETPAASPAPAATPAPVVDVIPPSAGSVTVASIVTNRKSLAGKTVTVRGKVMKYNGNILGFNWLHIQDGSGVEKDGTNDITVTSAGVAKVGDIVTITGTVVLDKDFGAGYSYAVMLQNATVK